MASERQSEETQGLVLIKVEGLRARVAADLAEQVMERLRAQGVRVERLDERTE